MLFINDTICCALFLELQYMLSWCGSNLTTPHGYNSVALCTTNRQTLVTSLSLTADRKPVCFVVKLELMELAELMELL
jgi:hypothetical protein